MKASTKRVHLYHCEACARPITATAGDAVYKVGPRTLCAECVTKAPTKTTVRPKTEDGRGAAAKARWEAMSPEAKRAKIVKMQAGRIHNAKRD